MTAVFTKTARSSANISFGHAAIAALVGCVFIVIPVFASELSITASLCLFAIAVLSLFWAVALWRTGRSYLSSGLDWRVEISDNMLTWQSPLQKVMPSFDTALTNIKILRHIKTRRSGKNVGYRNDFSIELVAGDLIKLSENVPGIDPAIVFEALEKHGVTLERQTFHTDREVKEKRRQQKVDKRAKRRGEPVKKLIH